MKRLTLSVLFVCFCSSLFSQVYKLETVFSDRGQTTFLSYQKQLDDASPKAGRDTFSLWGYQLYHDSWASGAYEVEYFKGNTAAMYHLLQEVDAFSGKYGNEDKVQTLINGVQVRTLKQMGFRYVLVFDRERKVVCKFTQKQWKGILADFESFCKTNGIRYNSP